MLVAANAGQLTFWQISFRLQSWTDADSSDITWGHWSDVTQLPDNNGFKLVLHTCSKLSSTWRWSHMNPPLNQSSINDCSDWSSLLIICPRVHYKGRTPSAMCLWLQATRVHIVFKWKRVNVDAVWVRWLAGAAIFLLVVQSPYSQQQFPQFLGKAAMLVRGGWELHVYTKEIKYTHLATIS